MKRKLLIAFGVFVSLILLSFVAIAVLPLSLYRESIERRVSEIIGRKVHLKGPMSHSLFDGPTVIFQNIEIDNIVGASDPYFATIETVKAEVRFWPLFIGKIDAELVTIDNAKVFLESLPEARTNWNLSMTKQNRFLSFSCNDFVLNNSQVLWRAPSFTTTMPIENVQVEFSDNHRSLAISLENAKLDRFVKGVFSGDVSLEFFGLSGRITLTSRNGLIDGVDLENISQRIESFQDWTSTLDLIDAAISGGTSRYNSIDVQIDIDNFIGTLTHAKMESESATAVGSGTIDFHDFTLDVTAWLSMKKHLQLPRFGVALSGPITSPTKKFETSELRDFLISHWVDRVLDKVLR